MDLKNSFASTILVGQNKFPDGWIECMCRLESVEIWAGRVIFMTMDKNCKTKCKLKLEYTILFWYILIGFLTKFK